MKKIVLFIIAVLITSMVIAGTLTYDTVNQKIKRMIKTVSMTAGQRIVIVKAPTKITGGTIILDETLPATVNANVEFKVKFSLIDK